MGDEGEAEVTAEAEVEASLLPATLAAAGGVIRAEEEAAG